jgi:hypothetical protein
VNHISPTIVIGDAGGRSDAELERIVINAMTRALEGAM